MLPLDGTSTIQHAIRVPGRECLMTEDEFKSLPRPAVERARVSAGPGPDGTLLFGYSPVTMKDDWVNVTHHVYRQGGVMHAIAYVTPLAGETLSVEEVRPEEFDPDSAARNGYAVHAAGLALPIDILIPRKRLYPEDCDASFCRVLLSAGVHLPFTSYDPNRTRPGQAFRALIASDMAEHVPGKGLAR